MDINDKEPPPLNIDNPSVWDVVYKELELSFETMRVSLLEQQVIRAAVKDRDYVGFVKYGTRLKFGNGRNAVRDLVQEVMDAAVYCRQAIGDREQLGFNEQDIRFMKHVYSQLLPIMSAMILFYDKTKTHEEPIVPGSKPLTGDF